MMWQTIVVRVVVACIIGWVARDQPSTLFVVALVFVLSFGVDLVRYRRSWEKHDELRASYPDLYDTVLREVLQSRSFEALVRLGWAEVELALRKRVGNSASN
jgi:hypothetical protein